MVSLYSTGQCTDGIPQQYWNDISHSPEQPTHYWTSSMILHCCSAGWQILLRITQLEYLMLIFNIVFWYTCRWCGTTWWWELVVDGTHWNITLINMTHAECTLLVCKALFCFQAILNWKWYIIALGNVSAVLWRMFGAVEISTTHQYIEGCSFLLGG